MLSKLKLEGTSVQWYFTPFSVRMVNFMNKGTLYELRFTRILFLGISLTLFRARGTKFTKKEPPQSP